MIKVDGKYFFVEWHTMSDLMGFKHSLGLEGAGSRSLPCPVCPCPLSEFTKNVREGKPPHMDARVDLDNIFPIPLSRQHGCAMHAHHRIVERILLEFVHVSIAFGSHSY